MSIFRAKGSLNKQKYSFTPKKKLIFKIQFNNIITCINAMVLMCIKTRVTVYKVMISLI